jgi:hypothetical protein
MKRSLAQFIILAVVWMVPFGASDAEPASSINLGLGGINPMPHCNALVYTIEYEHPLTRTVTILGRESGVNYHYDDGIYKEDGNIPGLDVGIRSYSSDGMRGFFWGSSLGYWAGNWTFIQDKNRPTERQGNSSSHSLRLNIEIGDRIPILSTNISIMPEVNLGKFFSSSSCEYSAPALRVGTPCSQKSEVNYYIFAGVTAGITF